MNFLIHSVLECFRNFWLVLVNYGMPDAATNDAYPCLDVYRINFDLAWFVGTFISWFAARMSVDGLRSRWRSTFHSFEFSSSLLFVWMIPTSYHTSCSTQT